jgi:Protein of unknown function (DUF3829)
MRFRTLVLALGATVAAGAAHAAGGTATDLTEKLQPYIKCINRISERAYQSQERYTSWAGKSAALNQKARNVLGLYEIYDPADCATGVTAGNAALPRHAELEAAGSGYVSATLALAAILKTANDYYDQSNYKDDKMAMGKDLHPKLLVAFAAFDKADTDLRGLVEKLNDEKQLAQLAEIEKREGRNDRYLVEVVMIKAKGLVRANSTADEKNADLARITEALGAYEVAVKELEEYAAKNKDTKLGSMLVSNAKTFLVSAKEFMRRVRDKVPYNNGERMLMGQAGAGWMVQGSPARVSRDYNQLIETYNRN